MYYLSTGRQFLKFLVNSQLAAYYAHITQLPNINISKFRQSDVLFGRSLRIPKFVKYPLNDHGGQSHSSGEITSLQFLAEELTDD